MRPGSVQDSRSSGLSCRSSIDRRLREAACKSLTVDRLTVATDEQPLDTRHAHNHGQPYRSRHALGCKASASWLAVRRA